MTTMAMKFLHFFSQSKSQPLPANPHLPMKIPKPIHFVIPAAALAALLAAQSVQAASLTWDANGTTAGQTTVSNPGTLKSLEVSSAAPSISGNTLKLTGGAITLGNVSSTITDGITGAPPVNWDGGNQSLTLQPAAGVSMTLGNVNVTKNSSNNNSSLNLDGSGTGNSLGNLTWAGGGQQLGVTKQGTGTWTIGGFSGGDRWLSVKSGVLKVTGTLATSHGFFLQGGELDYNNPGALGDSQYNTIGGLDVLGINHPYDNNTAAGYLDNTSGAAITTSTTNPAMLWNADFTFIGSNGAKSDLYLGTGAVTLNANRTVTVANAAATFTVGGVISGSGCGLTKAGAGTLKLTGANTFTGNITVSGGTLAISQAAHNTMAKVTVNSGAVMRLDYPGTFVVSGLVLKGVSKGSGYYNSKNAAPYLTGTGSLFVVGDSDSDRDGIPDKWMIRYFGHPTGQASDHSLAQDDPDSDGLTNLQEYRHSTDPTNRDTDGDGLSDGDEVNKYHTNPLLADTDGDGLSDGDEVNTHHTNPLKADTDGDGAGDWYEVKAAFTDPNDRKSKPNIPYPLPKPDGSAGVTNKPVKVYIMSGQSNMQGMGEVNGTAPGTLSTVVKQQGKFPNLIDASGNWSVRKDVMYRGVISCIGNGPLTAGQGNSSGNLGPELGFGQVMGYCHDEPVLLIKASEGGQALAWDFLPPGSAQYTVGTTTYGGYGDSSSAWTTGTTPVPAGSYGGHQFDQCFLRKVDWAPAGKALAPVFNVTNVLDNFATEYPQYAAQGFEIAGFVWWQGWNDCMGDSSANRYEKNLAQFIRQIRLYYERIYPGKIKPKAPFVLATCGFSGWAQASPIFLAVVNAQLAVSDPVKYPEFAGNVKTMESRSYWRELPESPNNEIYHYYRNAETYMLVGDALGRAMIDLSGTGTLSIHSP